eukprot:12929319-Prorocentrum_lima.AAC.1
MTAKLARFRRRALLGQLKSLPWRNTNNVNIVGNLPVGLDFRITTIDKIVVETWPTTHGGNSTLNG